MQYLVDLLIDLGIIVASIVALLVFLYLFLHLVQWGIKLRHGNREQDGLNDLWQDSLKYEKPSQNEETDS